jgi:uncharacterized SAM-binding protein YcdF (DUF218 family)
MKKRLSLVGKVAKALLMGFGAVFLILCALAFTDIPFWAYYRLGTTGSRISSPPATIVLLSGTGIPSEGGLLRPYYTARIAAQDTAAQIYISIPGDLSDSLSDPRLTAAELMLRGVAENRIHFEPTGRNTREQAQKIAALLTSGQLSQSITLVTSPEHVRRAVLSFRKCGFTNVSGSPSFEFSLKSDLKFNDKELKGNTFVPAIGHNLQVRYLFWSHMRLELLVFREYFALGYYWFRGWI